MMDQHIILCGLGRVGWRVLDHLRASGTEVVVIDNHGQADDPRLQGSRLIQGDCRQPENLLKADIATARGVLVVTSDDLINLSTALAVHQLNPGVRLVVRMFNRALLDRLGKGWNLAVLSVSALAAPLLALIARTGEALGAFKGGGRTQQVTEVHVGPGGSGLAGLRVREVAERGRCAIVAYVPNGQPCRFLAEIDPEATLAAGDRLVTCGDPSVLASLTAGPEASTTELLWAGKIRRFARVAARTLAEVDRPVLICTAILLAVILGSTLIFHLTMRYDNLSDALYRTIGLMATAADMKGRELEPGGWQKAFVSILRILGVALVAAFTAILTNYLVRAQLGGALEVRRIPERGHIVVCGLGNVGFRVVEELLRQEEPVVILERSRDNAFIAPARRKGAAVVVGDATLTDVLRQTRAASARAVVAVTNNELVNLEVALLTRELNPAQRVVVRLIDPQLALTLRQTANIRFALSVPELAAPAFVAALYGDRVRGVFLIEGRLLAAAELVVQPLGDPWEGRAVPTLAADQGLQPVCLIGADGQAEDNLSQARLRPGDRLTAIVGLQDLQRLLRRERLTSQGTPPEGRVADP
jgi:Trk K+ transport system NAD-binding subunit